MRCTARASRPTAATTSRSSSSVQKAVTPSRAERGLHPLQVDAQAVQLDEAAAAADHFVDPVGRAARDITGVQGVDGLAKRQIRGTVRVAHHDIGAVVHQLADVGIRPSVERLEGERPAGIGLPIDAGSRLREIWGQVSHSGGGFRRAVHHEQLPALALAERGEAAHAFWCKPPTRLGDVPQIGQIDVVEADPIEHLEGVGHTGERGAAMPAEQRPELIVDDGTVGEDQPGATKQVAVDDRKAVAV